MTVIFLQEPCKILQRKIETEASRILQQHDNSEGPKFQVSILHFSKIRDSFFQLPTVLWQHHCVCDITSCCYIHESYAIHIGYQCFRHCIYHPEYLDSICSLRVEHGDFVLFLVLDVVPRPPFLDSFIRFPLTTATAASGGGEVWATAVVPESVELTDD